MSQSPGRPPWEWDRPGQPPQPRYGGPPPTTGPEPREPRRAVLIIGCVAVLIGALFGGAVSLLSPSPVSSESEASPPAEPDPDTHVAAAKAAVDSLPVKGRAPKTGYDREAQFGEPWVDTDANGCDTRNDILKRDLTQVAMRDGCIVESGVLQDPYSGTDIDFTRGPNTSSQVQIDHVVALSNAWQTGAQQMTYAERVAFANDPLELLAVDGPLNQQKGAGDAATWLPPNKAFRCEYVSLQVLVKDRWGLWLTPPEKDAIQRELAEC